MKRKLAWLTLPLVLCALVWGLKWRADHPIVTKEDLEFRAVTLEHSWVEVGFYSPTQYARIPLHKRELKEFIDCLYVLPQSSRLNRTWITGNGDLGVHCVLYKPRRDGVNSMSVLINIDRRIGVAVMGYKDKEVSRNLHPVTVKRWIELLLNHPRIGPELRARMNR